MYSQMNLMAGRPMMLHPPATAVVWGTREEGCFTVVTDMPVQERVTPHSGGLVSKRFGVKNMTLLHDSSGGSYRPTVEFRDK
jgi:hypothetical protein